MRIKGKDRSRPESQAFRIAVKVADLAKRRVRIEGVSMSGPLGISDFDPPEYIKSKEDLEAYVSEAVAAERERIAQVVRDFPHWLGPQAKRELLAAMGLEE